MEFWDSNGEGWEVLKWVPLDHGDQSTAEVEATLTFLLWLIRLSSPDIEANYDTESVFELILRAHPRIADAVGLLLDLGPPGAIDKLLRPSTFFASRGAMKTFEGEGITLLCYLTILQKWDHVHMLLALGANPHQVRLNTHFSPIAESPLSLAMYSSWAFWVFRDALHKVGFDTEEIARQELKQGCPLLDAGWRMETLSGLLEFEFEPDFEPLRPHMNYYCCDCCDGYVVHVEVQPYWQNVLESIKNSTPPQMVSSDTQDEQPLNGQSHLAASNRSFLSSITDGSESSHRPAVSEDRTTQPDKESLSCETDMIPDRKEVWCIWCWYYYKDNGHRRSMTSAETQESDGGESSEDDFSPFLFNS